MLGGVYLTNESEYLLNMSRKDKNSQETMLFDRYLGMVKQKPILAQTSVQRIYNMIISHNVEVNEDGQRIYPFFNRSIFGAEQQIEDIMTYLEAASLGLDIKKRVCLLLGPPGGGKSAILSLIKKGLAEYTRTSDGAVYGIKQCPINENPLHLITDQNERDILWERFKIKIEGKLCPHCQFEYKTNWINNVGNTEIQRVYISEENRIGVGTFAPSEKNDMSELYGSADLSNIDFFGTEGDPRAYTFNGELHVANRGLMEFIEVLKASPTFLHVLLTLAEEQQFKVPRFPLQYVDELLIAHTNEGEFQRFINVKENEAVVDRLYIVRMPYNMKAEHEELIYFNALKTKLVVKGKRIHPGALRLASEFVIETRKHEDPLREGMSGISPRFILNTLGIALVRFPVSEVSPKQMFQLLLDQISSYPVLTLETRQKYNQILGTIGNKLQTYDRVRHEDIKIPHYRNK